MFCSSVQSEKACDKEDDDDDADNVEDVHGVLRLRHARFQNESGAPTGTSRSASKFHSPRKASEVMVVNSIQTEIVNRQTIDSSRLTAVAAAPHSVSPAF
jgi:hypothetical protein